MMTVHEFGKENGDVVVLIHPSAVMWDYFEHVIPLLRDRFHLIIPALPGYDEKVDIQNAVVDGGITPYRLPWIVTRLIAVRDFLLVCIGRWGGAGLLEKAFSTGEYSEEDLQYVSEILRFMS